MIDRETLRNKILINHERFEMPFTASFFEGYIEGIYVKIDDTGYVYLSYDGVHEVMDTFKNVYDLLKKYKRDHIYATFGTP